MSRRAVINVATGPHYRAGQDRLKAALDRMGEAGHYWTHIPNGWPRHEVTPYGFKAAALKTVADMRQFHTVQNRETGELTQTTKEPFTSLLWCDACILPIRSLEPLWERIERYGYWFSANGYSNYEWTADSAYRDLFGAIINSPNIEIGTATAAPDRRTLVESAVVLNRKIPHVVATAFGISLEHEIGRAFLAAYYRLATETKSFCGPWMNSNHPDYAAQRIDGVRCAPCGASDVRGHRHDQTAASVIAHRLGMKLTNAPEIFAYKGGETSDTILLAHGSY